MGIRRFVEDNFGTEYKNKLENIGKGGENNAKGNCYEAHLVYVKICEISANHILDDLDAISISTQTESFVDDLCIKNNITSTKFNYQAKNSSLQAAVWSDEQKDRFCKQKIIDLNFWNFSQSKNIFVVSSKDKHIKNQQKIQATNEPDFLSEFIPDCKTTYELRRSHPILAEALKKITAIKEPNAYDTVLRSIAGAWAAVDQSKEHSLGDLLGVAKETIPDFIVDKIEVREIPSWLINFCDSLPNVKIKITSGIIFVILKELEIYLGRNPVISDEIKKLSNDDNAQPIDRIQAVMNLSTTAINERA